jgi:hypothetical protein
MELVLFVFLGVLGVGLLRAVDWYRSRDRFPPLPAVSTDNPVLILPDAATLSDFVPSSHDASPFGQGAPANCNSGQGLIDAGHCGDFGGSSQH